MSATATSSAPAGAPKRDLAELRAVGKQVAKAAGGTSVQAFFEANKPTLAALLPRHMTPERMLKIALSALRTTPQLMECTVQSLFGAVVYAAQLGLEPNTPQGHLYFIPFRNSRKGTTEVQIIVGYKGLIDLSRRSGQIVSISARVRYANDPWKMKFGTEDYIEHEPAEGGDRGQMVGVYAVAKLKDGGVQFEYLTRGEVERIRDGSEGYRAALATAKKYGKPPRGPWIEHFEEMARKTAIRRLCKYLPMSIELANAVALDEHAEGGRTQNLGSVLDGVEYTVMSSEDGPAPEEGEAEEARATEKTAETGGARVVDRLDPTVVFERHVEDFGLLEAARLAQQSGNPIPDAWQERAQAALAKASTEERRAEPRRPVEEKKDDAPRQQRGASPRASARPADPPAEQREDRAPQQDEAGPALPLRGGGAPPPADDAFGGME